MTSTVFECSKRMEIALSKYKMDLHSLGYSYYLWKYIREKSRHNRMMWARQTNDPLLWRTIEHSLQTTQFTALGRIFDQTKGTFNTQKFRKTCITNILAFTPDALELRRAQALKEDLVFTESDARLNPVEIDSFISSKYESGNEKSSTLNGESLIYFQLNVCDIDYLFDSLDRAKTEYIKTGKDVRDKLVSHSNNEIGTDFDSIGGMRINDLERVIDDLAAIYYILCEVFIYGNMPRFVPRVYKPKQELETSVDTVLMRMLGNAT